MIMEKHGDTFICNKCGYEYQKGEHNAKILETLCNASGPVTARHIQDATLFSISTVKNCLQKLCMQKRVEKHSFKKEQRDPIEYKTYEKGKTPKYYYRITQKGQEMLKYYKNKDQILGIYGNHRPPPKKII